MAAAPSSASARGSTDGGRNLRKIGLFSHRSLLTDANLAPRFARRREPIQRSRRTPSPSRAEDRQVYDGPDEAIPGPLRRVKDGSSANSPPFESPRRPLRIPAVPARRISVHAARRLLLKITFLGTSSGVPTRERNVSAVVLDLDGTGETWLFDCGEGTQHRVLQAGVRPTRLRRIFVTHMHGDHVFGLPGLLCTLNLACDPEGVDVYGPEGLGEFLSESMQRTGWGPEYPFAVHVVAPGVVHEDDRHLVRCAALRHNVTSFGFRVEEKPVPGRLDAARALALGVPSGPLLGRLKAGEDVTLDDGTVVRAEGLTLPPRRGRVFAYVTDTAPCAGGVELAREADLVVHEATYTTEDADRLPQRLHSTALGAASVARDAGARRLFITHFSPRYGSPRPLLDEACMVFPETEAAEDLLRVEIPVAGVPTDRIP